MDSTKIKDWMEVVGMFVLVAAIIFVGLQMKQAREIAIYQTHFARSDTIVQHLTAGAENPYFLAARAKIDAGIGDSLTPLENQAMARTLQATLYLMSDAHYQYTNGFISAERWDSSRNTLKSFMRVDSPYPARSVFERNPNEWDSEFRQVVFDVLSEIDAESTESKDVADNN